MLKIITSRVFNPLKINELSDKDKEFIKGVESTSYLVINYLVFKGNRIISSITISFNSGILVS